MPLRAHRVLFEKIALISCSNARVASLDRKQRLKLGQRPGVRLRQSIAGDGRRARENPISGSDAGQSPLPGTRLRIVARSWCKSNHAETSRPSSAQFIALEAALHCGRAVSAACVGKENVRWKRVLGTQAWKIYSQLHESHGVVFRLGE